MKIKAKDLTVTAGHGERKPVKDVSVKILHRYPKFTLLQLKNYKTCVNNMDLDNGEVVEL